MIYLDTSFLMSLFRQEEVSESIGNFLATRVTGSLAVSQWTRVELASVIARDVRMKSPDETTAHKLLEACDALIEESFHLLIPTAADFNLAHDFVSNFATKLRGPDALHLAIARNHGVEEILTLDDGLLFAAKKLKIKARRGIRS